MQLDRSTGNTVELPQNLTFLSVLGKRYWQPGNGGECRFVFDPPLLSGQGYRGSPRLNYTHVDTGNPNRTDITSPGTFFHFSNETKPPLTDGRLGHMYDGVHLLDQQLDPSIHYKFAIVSGPTSSEGLIGGQQDANYFRSSPNPCPFTKVEMWQL